MIAIFPNFPLNKRVVLEGLQNALKLKLMKYATAIHTGVLIFWFLKTEHPWTHQVSSVDFWGQIILPPTIFEVENRSLEEKWLPLQFRIFFALPFWEFQGTDPWNKQPKPLKIGGKGRRSFPFGFLIAHFSAGRFLPEFFPGGSLATESCTIST